MSFLKDVYHDREADVDVSSVYQNPQTSAEGQNCKSRRTQEEVVSRKEDRIEDYNGELGDFSQGEHEHVEENRLVMTSIGDSDDKFKALIDDGS